MDPDVLVNGLRVHQLISTALGACSYHPFGQLLGPGCQSSLRSQRAEAPRGHWFGEKLTQ